MGANPRRFESRRTGKSGYAPACANEWVRGVCEKPRIKCADCPNRQFLPLSERVVRWHLSGQDDAGQPFVAGVYPMLVDETCFFLAIDFDKQSWTEDAQAYVETCRRMSIPAALERSRSGCGGHVWCFRIDVAVIQSLVRKGVVHNCVGQYGHVIVDECHHLLAHSFEQVARRAKARFVLGLSATVTRKDGHQPIIFMQCGPVRHRVDAKAQAALRPFRHSVIVCPTPFAPRAAQSADQRVEFQALYTALAENDARNRAICDDVVEALQEHGYTVLRFLAEDLARDLDRFSTSFFGHWVALMTRARFPAELSPAY